MCQVAPFTFPCCRKVYVEVTKVPSCPNSWPNRKCPPELCIQVRGYEPEDRDSGVCWRCKAKAAGVVAADRESLRPRIDKATLVLGLDELGVPGRRRREEQNGNCWFCGATGGCKACGTTEIELTEDEVKVEATGKRKRDIGSAKGKEVVKKFKLEKDLGQKTPTRAFEYSALNSPSHPRYPYPHVFTQEYQYFDQQPQSDIRSCGPNDLPRLPQTDVSKYCEAGSTQYPLLANWQPIYTHQNASTEMTSAYQGHQASQFSDDGRYVNSTAQYCSSEHISHSEPDIYPSLLGDKSPISGNAGLWFDRTEQEDEHHMEVMSRFHSAEQLSRNVVDIHPLINQTSTPRLPSMYTNSQQSSQYIHDGERQDYKSQESNLNGYPPDPHANVYLEHDISYDERGVQETSNGYTCHHENSQTINEEPQYEFKHERSLSSQNSCSSLDPNIQPGLDDLPLQCDLAKIDDTTLARLSKKYGGDIKSNGVNSNVDVKLAQEAVTKHGGSGSSKLRRP
ncbi:hypothetical protein ONS96_004123 [Cadophora gregata f. sp. sojae]|nr:hypothetical protein ONS96_004123 [Cadophora gregata f. sp. sojae]